MVKVIYKYDAGKYNETLAEAIKKIPEMQAPEWSFYVKSGTSRKRVPADEDFWYHRAASILRQLYIQGVIGVEKLRTRYGGRKDKGVKRDRFKKASGKIIRTILKQAEEAGLVEKISIGKQAGRRLTEKGRDFLNSIEVKDKSVKKEVPVEKEVEVKKEVEETKPEEIDNGKETQQEE